MTAKLFIDGSAGTTGLEIRERLAVRRDISLVALSDADRKDPRARKAALNDADIVILCLPDAAAKEAVALIENPAVRVIDASSAHRTAPGWVYGFSELDPGQHEKIAAARRVSNPGCYAVGFLALVRPLVCAKLISRDFPVTVNAIEGYSGGGRVMIEEFEKRDAPAYVETVVRTYALGLGHKHVPEMQMHSGLVHPPLFAPSVGRFYRGEIVDVPLQLWALPGRPSAADLHVALAEAYAGHHFVTVVDMEESAGLKTLDAELLKGTDFMQLYVFANEAVGQVRLTAVLDNLGKGAGGAAVQNLNIMLGLPELVALE